MREAQIILEQESSDEIEIELKYENHYKDKYVSGVRLENKILILSFNDDTELTVDLSSLSGGTVTTGLTEEQIKAIHEMVVTTGNELIIEYDDEILDIGFSIKDNNLIVENNVEGLKFDINENKELEAIY